MITDNVTESQLGIAIPELIFQSRDSGLAKMSIPGSRDWRNIVWAHIITAYTYMDF